MGLGPSLSSAPCPESRFEGELESGFEREMSDLDDIANQNREKEKKENEGANLAE